MATTFLSNATVTMTVGVTSYTLSAQASNVSVEVGYEPLDATAFGDNGRVTAKGLQSATVSMTLFNYYGSNSTEAALYDAMNTGTCTLVISPSGTTESASNPEYTITGCTLSNFTPIQSAVGELSAVEVEFNGGTWARDIVTP
jgi:hypothetical protein